MSVQTEPARLRDRATERTFPSRALDVDMNPLTVAGAMRERVDALLVERDPRRDADLLSDPFGEVSGSGTR